MIRTHRRLNLAQAHKLSGLPWATAKELQAAGAYGSEQSIRNAMRKLMLKEDAAAIAQVKRDGRSTTIYRITPAGYAKLGMVPVK